MADDQLAIDSGRQLALILDYVEAFTDEFLCDLRKDGAMQIWDTIALDVNKIPGVIKGKGLDLLLQWNDLKRTVRDMPPHERNPNQARVQEIADKNVLNHRPTQAGTSSTPGQASTPPSGTSVEPVAGTSSASTDASATNKTFDPRYPLAKMSVQAGFHNPIDESTPCQHRGRQISTKPMGPIDITRESLLLTFEPYHPDDPGRSQNSVYHFHHNSKKHEAGTSSGRNDTCSLIITSTPLCIVPLQGRIPRAVNTTIHQVQNTLATVCSSTTTSTEHATKSNTIPYQVYQVNHHNPLAATCSSTMSVEHGTQPSATPDQVQLADHHDILAAACSSISSTEHGIQSRATPEQVQPADHYDLLAAACSSFLPFTESGATADLGDNSQLPATSESQLISLPPAYYALLDSVQQRLSGTSSSDDQSADDASIDSIFDPKSLE